MSVLERLGDALAVAKTLGATDVEVSHSARTLGMTRFASSAITQSGVVEERLTRVRVALGDRIGAATTSGLDAEALGRAAALALEAARPSPPQLGFRGFARPGGDVPATTPARSPGPDERADVLARLFRRAAADKLLLAGSFQSGLRTCAVRTAAGLEREASTSEAQLSVIALDGDASGHAARFDPDAASLDPDGLAEEACATAARARDPVTVAPAAIDVVLAPAAVAELLEWLAMGSFSARAVLDGTSFLAGRAGAPVCDERISIVDDPGLGLGVVPFDAEGTPRARVALIDRGRAGAPISDLASAIRLGTSSTGHALALGTELGDGPTPASLALLVGADSPGDTIDDLVGRVERGLYVTRFNYVNGLLDTRRALMTGMTRDGLLHITDGKLGKAVKNLRFTESILEAFARLGGIGKDLRAIPGNWLSSPTLCPALLVRGFHFTGASR